MTLYQVKKPYHTVCGGMEGAASVVYGQTDRPPPPPRQKCRKEARPRQSSVFGCFPP